MAEGYYVQARKAGEKAYREALYQGKNPFLPALEDTLPKGQIVNEVPLGVREIPLGRVDGTYTAARQNAFAPNFMPLLSTETEFSDKWEYLCEAHLEEGINTPIKAYEYLHRFYVIEGNKRVSVMKFFDAASIAANIIRIIPKRDGSLKIKVYFEYLDFYAVCPTLSLVFSAPGDYREFQEMAGKKPEELWTSDEVRDLEAFYTRFYQAYKHLGGKELHRITTSDALLTYLHFYPYREAVNKYPAEITADLRRIWDEIVLSTAKERVEMVLDPEDVPEQSILMKLLSGSPKKLKAAFIYDRSPMQSGWAYGQDLGRMHIDEVFGDAVETTSCQDIDEKNIDGTLEYLIAQGTDLIFVTTPVFTDACVRAAALHRDVKILVAAIDLPHSYIRTYYPRFYEAKYLSGILAGILAESPEIGYIADYPTHSNIAAANAFALGVQAVCPAARVHLQWTQQKNADPMAYFAERNITLISDTALRAPKDESRAFGLYRVTEKGRENIAMTTVNWGVLFQLLIDSIQSGRWENESRLSGGKALNYWFGFSNGVLELFYSHTVPERTREFVDRLKREIKNGTLLPFSGVIRSQEGPVTEDASDALSPKEIATMDWLNENIVGSLPAPETLTDTAGKLMRIEREVEFEEGGRS